MLVNTMYLVLGPAARERGGPVQRTISSEVQWNSRSTLRIDIN